MTVGEGGVVFQFGPLGEEESTEVVLEIVAPTDAGDYAKLAAGLRQSGARPDRSDQG